METKILNANGRNIRISGVIYRIISLRLGSRVLADAENIKTGERVNLMKSRSPLCMNIRKLIGLGLFV